ncbi:AmmeMemoRadiSam system radical SAM enzyme [Campylobacterota bacterium DY0563]
MQYFKTSNTNLDKKTCLLCSYYCDLKEGQIGVCGVNKNIGEKIECLVYGHISAFNIDPIEKKPLYHFLPNSKSLSLGTVGCNFHCNFCQNHGISQEKKIDKSNYISAKDVAQIAKQRECKSISYTYNEPTIFYPFAKDIALEGKKFGIKSVFVSNGFESEEVIDDMSGVIDAINVDLKSFNHNYYKTKLGGNLEQVLSNLIRFKKNKIWLEITTLLVPTKNDSEEEIRKIVRFIKENLGVNTPWHISAFHPDYKELNLPRTSFEKLKMAYDIAKSEGLLYVYIGNIGFPNNTYCPKCNEKLISREYFNVLDNRLTSRFCPNCNTKIDGIFEGE